MKTPIFHPHFSQGAIDVPRFRGHNQHSYIRTLIEVIIDALKNPNAHYPLNIAAAELLETDLEQFKEIVHNQLQFGHNE